MRRTLSPHCAFQLGPGTHEEQTHGYPWRGAPAGQAYRHLLSSLRLFAPLFLDLPWRTFTLSAPLQRGLWLRRRLGPPSRVLACSHPLRVLRLQSSLRPLPDVIAPRSCLLDAGWSREAVPNVFRAVWTPTVPFWAWRLSQFRHSIVTTLQTQVSFVSIGHRVRAVSPGLARRFSSLSTGFTPQGVPLPDACRSTLLSLLKQGSY